MKALFILFVAIFFICGCSEAPAPTPETIVEISKNDEINRIENGLVASIKITGEAQQAYSIESRLAFHDIPGVSVAVAHKGELLWAKAYGFADIAQAREMTTETMLLAGSISKPVSALRALQLHDQGKFLLDENVNTYLTSWQLPDNEFTETEKVTLRRILNHSAGLTVWGFPGYDKGDDIPSTVEVLDGLGNTDAVRVYKTPGESWQYSGGGTTIMQLAISDIEQAPFAETLQTKVLNPMGMAKSTFINPLPEQYHSIAATGYRSDLSEVEGKWPIYPEMAAAGLWTTPSQLVKYGIAVQDVITTKQDGIISYDTALQMLTPGDNDFGLGPVVSEYSFSHGGADEGFRAHFVAWTDSPYVAVVMVNSDTGAIINEILRSIAREYSLPGYEQIEKTVLEQPKEVLEKYVGSYKWEDEIFEISATKGGLMLTVENFDFTSKLLPQGPAVFFEKSNGTELEFVIEENKPMQLNWRNMTAVMINK